MQNIKHVFFDLDHTLWDFDKNSALAFERVFHTHKVSVALPDFLKVYEPINFNYWKAYREERVTKNELRHGRFVDTFKEFGVTFPSITIEKMALSYIEELPGNNHLLPGAEDILKYLQGNYRLHIITNGFIEVQDLKLTKSKIAHFFETVTSSEEVGVKKPNPKVFHHALNKANATAEESIMIGDTFEADILGAEGVGMQTLYYNYRDEEIPNHYIKVDDLLSIKKYL